MTKDHGAAVTKLAKELKLEPQYVRANPWFPGQSREQSDELAKQLGFEEGASSSSAATRESAPTATKLNPRTSEAGEGRAAMHVTIKGPGEVGTIDVYITHLTGGGERIVC